MTYLLDVEKFKKGFLNEFSRDMSDLKATIAALQTDVIKLKSQVTVLQQMKVASNYRD